MTRSRFLDHLRAEDGIAIVIAMILMFLMLAMGLAAIKLSDSQSQLTSRQRQRETSFNVAEAALNAQVTQLSDHWIGMDGTKAGATTFGPCPGGSYCPDGTELTSMVPSGDTAAETVDWKTRVIDNAGTLANYYSDAQVTNQCGCDGNGDGKVWVRAQATVRGRIRTIVSLVQQQTQAESVPHAAILAGALSIGNSGNKAIIQTNGGLLAVRCTVPASGDPDPKNPCLGQGLGAGNTKDADRWNDLLSKQIDGFAGAAQSQAYPSATVFSQDQIYRFINTAKAEGTYYPGCPSSLTGHLVVIDTTGDCAYQGSGDYNTQADPGFVIMLRATSTLSVSGTRKYYGIVYHANMGNPPILSSPTQSSGTLVTVTGNAKIIGGVIIDGPGRMQVGESAVNVQFDDHGYDAVRSFAGAGIIQNSWREIQPGT